MRVLELGMDRAKDIAVRLDKVDEDLKKLRGREDNVASIRKKHLTAIGEHLQSQLIEELEWEREQPLPLKISRKKKLKR